MLALLTLYGIAPNVSPMTIDTSKGLNTIKVPSQFSTVEKCREIIFKLRYPNGLYCESCNTATSLPKQSRQIFLKRVCSKGVIRCPSCRKDISVLSGTVFAGSRLSLPAWFRAIYAIAVPEHPVSTLQLCKQAGIVRWQTAQHVARVIRKLMYPEKLSKTHRNAGDYTLTLMEYPGISLCATVWEPKKRGDRERIVLWIQRPTQSEYLTSEKEEYRSIAEQAARTISQIGTNVINNDNIDDYAADIGFKMSYSKVRTPAQERCRILTELAIGIGISDIKPEYQPEPKIVPVEQENPCVV
jgi:transposase-like protein